MKSRVSLSRFSSILTLIIFVAFIAGLVLTHNDTGAFITLCVLTLFLLIPSMIFGPLYISATDTEVNIVCPIKIHTIPMRRIVGVERFQPTMGSIRICGSGGFMGYWGIFKEGDIGRYMAYYGRSSDCFLIRLENGDKYVLGCNSPDEMVAYIKSHIRGKDS